MIETRTFYHGRIGYTFKRAKREFNSESIPPQFPKNIEKYFQLILSEKIPHQLFDNPQVLRCSKFRIKGLERGALKKISLQLIQNNYVKVITPDSNPTKEVPESLLQLSGIASDVYKVMKTEFQAKPGHDPILSKILWKNKNALAIESPIWASLSLKQISNNLRKKNPDYSQISQDLRNSKIFTGHIDLLLYDNTNNQLIVADYKPERNYIKSLPQVSIYGLVMKKFLNLDNVMCVSFSKDDAWYYDPEIIRSIIPRYLKQYGNPKLVWQEILKKI
jgi:hypothetical protein